MIRNSELLGNNIQRKISQFDVICTISSVRIFYLLVGTGTLRGENIVHCANVTYKRENFHIKSKKKYLKSIVISSHSQKSQ